MFKQNGFDILYDGPSFNEFVVKFDKPVEGLTSYLLQSGIIGGYDLGKVDPKYAGQMLVCVTEIRTKAEIDTFVEKVRAYHHG
jgi:glycine dehydrogenase subunit 1